MAAAIELLNEWSGAGGAQTSPKLDLILVTRGGGSLEDLWAFNEEVLARAIAASAVPVISAIGHEIDFTIADFVADVRAATPSAAAELITEGAFSSRQFVGDSPGRLAALARRRLGWDSEKLDALAHRLRLAHPRRRVEDGLQRLDDLRAELGRAARRQCDRRRTEAREATARLARLHPGPWLTRLVQPLREARRRLREQARAAFEKARLRNESGRARLQLLSPENVLSRGYSITTDAATGRVVRDAVETRPGQRLTTRLHHGDVSSVVER